MLSSALKSAVLTPQGLHITAQGQRRSRATLGGVPPSEGTL